MSNAVFPSLTALAWGRAKIPTWSTIVRTAISGKEVRSPQWSYPIWNFNLSYELLDNNAGLNSDLQSILGFFNLRQGSADDFLFEDITDNTATNVSIGRGDGVTTTFQLLRDIGYGTSTWVEPIKNVKGTPTIYVNGVALAQSAYTISPTGQVTFNSPPANGAALTATFNFYFRVRFADDSSEFNQFMYNLFELKKLNLMGVK